MVETKTVREASSHYGIGLGGATILGFFIFLSALTLSGNAAIALLFFSTFIWILLILGIIAVVAIVVIIIVAIAAS